MLPIFKSTSRDLTLGLLQLFFPRTCWVCGQLGPLDQSAICEACTATLLADPFPTCPRCSSSVGPYIDTRTGCPSCRDETFAFDQVIRLGPYDGPLRDVILRMKSAAGEGLAEVFGRLWASSVSTRIGALGPSLVVPVPLHWTRHWRRGFNQSEVLARALADCLRVPCRPRLLKRVRATPRQSGLGGKQARKDNVRGAFCLRRHNLPKGLSLVLVDDVLTTGATAHEAARQLLHLQPARIAVAVVGHGKPGARAGKL